MARKIDTLYWDLELRAQQALQQAGPVAEAGERIAGAMNAAADATARVGPAGQQATAGAQGVREVARAAGEAEQAAGRTRRALQEMIPEAELRAASRAFADGFAQGVNEQLTATLNGLTEVVRRNQVDLASGALTAEQYAEAMASVRQEVLQVAEQADLLSSQQLTRLNTLLSQTAKAVAAESSATTTALGQLAQAVQQAKVDLQAGTVTTEQYAQSLAQVRAQLVEIARTGGATTAAEVKQLNTLLVATEPASAKATSGVRQVSRGFATMATSALGARAGIGGVVGGLLAFSGGGAITLAVTAGLAAMVLGYRRLTQSQREARRESEALVAQLEKEQRLRANPAAEVDDATRFFELQRERLVARIRALQSGPQNTFLASPTGASDLALRIAQLRSLATAIGEVDQKLATLGRGRDEAVNDRFRDLKEGLELRILELEQGALEAEREAIRRRTDLTEAQKAELIALAEREDALERAAERRKEASERARDAARKAREEEARLAEERIRLVRDAEEALAEATTVLADDALLLVRRLAEENERAFTKAGQAIPVERAQQFVAAIQNLELARTLDALAPQLDAIERRTEEAIRLATGYNFAGPALDAVPALEAIIARLEQEVALTAEGSAAREEANRRLQRFRDLLREILGLLGKAEVGAADTTGQFRKQRTELLAQVRLIEQAVRGVLQLADAFGIVNEETARMLEDLLQIGTSIPVLLKELEGLRKGAEGASIGAVIGAALPILGGLASLGSTLFGESPAERARREAQKRNTDAIERLTLTIGELGAVLSGTAGTSVQGAQAAAEAFLERFPTRPKRVRSDGASAEENLVSRDFLNSVLAAGDLTRRELQDMAEQLGLTVNFFSDNAQDLYDAFRALQDALAGVELLTFSRTFAGQLEALRLELDLLDTTDPVAQLQKLREVLSGEFGSPLLRDALAGLDLTTAAGRAEAERRIQEIAARLRLSPEEGGLLPADLGGLTPDELVAILRELESLIDQANEEGGGSGSSESFREDRTITEVTGLRLVSFLTSIDVRMAQLVAQGQQALQYLAALAVAPAGLTPPALPAVPGATSTTTAGGDTVAAGLVVHFAGGLTVEVQVTAAPGQDPTALGALAGAAALDAIDRGLHQLANQKAYVAGALEGVRR